MMKSIRIIAIVFWLPCATTADVPDFSKDVAPILNEYCVGCHSADDPEADLVLESYEALVRGGENGPAINKKVVVDSLLLARLTAAKKPMPPEDEPRPSVKQIAVLVEWVKGGAKMSTVKRSGPTFDKIAASKAPKPITAIAHGSTSKSKITILCNDKISGVKVTSKQGLLDPPGNNVAPFLFALSNTPNSVVLAIVPGTVTVDGSLELPIGYLGDDPENDLTIEIGLAGGLTQEVPYRLGELFAVARFGEVGLFKGASKKLIRQLKTPGKVHDLKFNKDTSKLVAATGIAGVRGEAILWNTNDGEVIQRFQGHDDTIYSISITTDGSLVATGSYDRQIIIWDTRTGKQLRTLRGHNGAIFDLAFSPDGKVLASASGDATIKIWNVPTGERLDTLGQPLKEQCSLDISPDGKFVVAGGEYNRIRMWRLVSIDKPQINPIRHARFAHEGTVQKVRFSADGKHVVSSSTDMTLKIWSADDLELQNSQPVPDDTTEALALHGKTITMGRRNGQVQVFPLETNKEWTNSTQATQLRRIFREGPIREHREEEPNDTTSAAKPVELPAKITGMIHAPNGGADEDVFKFSARAGEEWIVEVKAARDKSPLDSHVAILDQAGSAIPRVQLQAVRDTYFTFRGKDSNGTGDFRLHNWEEMQLNQYLYSSGEVVKLFHYPRGPDSGFNVYANYGSRRGYFGTTPLAHALHEPAYIVEPHAPGVKLPPNGLPVFTLNYENDDDSQRRLGKDSRLTFVAPKDGDYFLVLRDVRGMQGEDFRYELFVRTPKPGFKCKVMNSNPKVVPGSGKKIGFEVERVDGFNGPIDVQVDNLPDGFSIAGPLQVEAGHDRMWATLLADADAKTPAEEAANKVQVVASANINDETVKHEAGKLGKIEVSDSTKLLVKLVPDHEPTAGEADLPVIELKPGGKTTATIKITRKDHDARVGFGSEDAAVNAPHGVYVDNIGLNGVLIVEGQSERQFFITAEPWVKPMERVIFVESGDADKPTSNPVILRILPSDEPKATDQVSR